MTGKNRRTRPGIDQESGHLLAPVRRIKIDELVSDADLDR
jgi:hypothetical protein